MAIMFSVVMSLDLTKCLLIRRQHSFRDVTALSLTAWLLAFANQPSRAHTKCDVALGCFGEEQMTGAFPCLVPGELSTSEDSEAC